MLQAIHSILSDAPLFSWLRLQGDLVPELLVMLVFWLLGRATLSRRGTHEEIDFG